MAVKFSSSFATMAASMTRFVFASNFSATVYSGSLASPSTIIANWSTYNQNSAICLWHGSGINWGLLGTNILNASTVPPAAAPFRNGTASWFIAWTVPVSSVNTVSIPTTRFVVGDVSNLFGTGIMKFVDTALTTSTTVTISDLSFKYNYVG
jgi:hypothetical protein